jgi:hypothetical protein
MTRGFSTPNISVMRVLIAMVSLPSNLAEL